MRCSICSEALPAVSAAGFKKWRTSFLYPSTLAISSETSIYSSGPCATKIDPGPYKTLFPQYSLLNRGTSVPKATGAASNPSISQSRMASGYSKTQLSSISLCLDTMAAILFFTPGRSDTMRTSHSALADAATMLCFSPPESVPMLNVEGPRRSDVGHVAAERSFKTASNANVALLPRWGYPEWLVK